MSSSKIRVDDLRRFVFISDPQLSPDGDRVAFVHTKIDYQKDCYVKHIWILDRDSGKATQFTYGQVNDRYPRWSPDGRQILFLCSNRLPEKKKPQLWVIPSDYGESRLVAELEDAGVTKPAWAPDSKMISFMARVWEGEKAKTDVKVVKRINFKLNGVGLFPGKRIHLFTVREGGKPKQLTKGEFDVEDASWSPDGRSIALVTNTDEDADFSFIRDVYTIPAKGGDMERLTKGEHLIENLSYSPGGDEIAYLGHDLHAHFRATNTDIWVMPSEGGNPINLTSSFDRSIGRRVCSDVSTLTPNPGAVWSPDGSTIYFLTGSIPTANVYSVDRRSSEVEQLTDGRNVEGFSLSADASVMAYSAMDATSLAEIWVKDDVDEMRVTSFNERILRELKISAPEHFMFKNERGTDIDAWIMKPPEFVHGKKYPAILEIHGGPLSIHGDTMKHEFQFLAAEGYIILYTNPRGSGGYGEEYGATLLGRFGTVDYADLMTFMDQTLECYDFIDPERLGVTGGSYGGYMTNWIVTHTDRFKAAVADRSSCNRHSHHGYSAMAHRNHGPAGNMGYPWKDEDKLLKQSPIRYAANAKTPTLLISAENDLDCPMGQSEEFFVTLKTLGVDTELVRFPDEDHGLSSSGKPKHREERLWHMLRWFNKYLKPSSKRAR